MSDRHAENIIAEEEITDVAPVQGVSSNGASPRIERNAFTELMAPKPKPTQEVPTLASMRGPLTRRFHPRDGLGEYTANPAAFPPSRVLYYNESFVAINDMYPKSFLHTLLLPRSLRSRLHPFDAFEDPDFLAAVRTETARLKRLVAKELQRLLGKFSEQEKLREAVLNGEIEWEDGAPLPAGRDWEKDLIVGIHAKPSMNDLHIHVLSRDMVSQCMRNRNHYMSFNTPFLVDLACFPLASYDPRRDPADAGYFGKDLCCWRCGKNFGNRFKLLKMHLAEEFDQWKKE
ncbi:HIT domain-containing protein [Xylaria nigripes]|nr:HIT domain-containing protein [Xylaria nigripes]